MRAGQRPRNPGKANFRRKLADDFRFWSWLSGLALILSYCAQL